MATAAFEAEAPLDTADNDAEPQTEAPRDWEREARSMRWAPKEEFKGDPALWVDAETYVRDSEEVLPLVKKRVKIQDRRIADLEKTVERQMALMTTAEKRGYERGIADLKVKQEEAVESGDIGAFRAIDKQIDKLREEAAATSDTPQVFTIDEAKSAFIDWREENMWFDRAQQAGASEIERNARVYYDLMADKYLAKTQEMSPPEFFEYIGGLVDTKFPQLKAKGARAKPASDVSAPTNGRGAQATKSYAAMPAEARSICDSLIRRKALPGKDIAEQRAYYANTVDWNEFK